VLSFLQRSKLRKNSRAYRAAFCSTTPFPILHKNSERLSQLQLFTKSELRAFTRNSDKRLRRLNRLKLQNSDACAKV
jgi:hypothetical protein